VKLPTAEPFLRDRIFWVRYLRLGVNFRGCDSLLADERKLSGTEFGGVRIEFPFPQEFGLTLTLSEYQHRLELIHPSLSEPALLGWMDFQQMSDVFRREEFETLIGCLATHNNSGREPWMNRILLGLYVAPLREYEEEYPSMLRDAVSASGLFTATEAAWVEAYTRTVTRRDFQWRWGKRGWMAFGEDAYSLRSRGNREFPFALLREFFGVIEGTDSAER